MSSSKINSKTKHGPTSVLPVFDSQGQAVGSTGIPDKIWRRAKRDGCPAFRGSRIYLDEFLKWYFSQDHKPDPKEKLFIAKLKRAEFATRREKVETFKAEESVIPKAEAKRIMTRYAVANRERWLALPKRVALPLSLLKEPSEFEQRLAVEVRGTLGQLFRHEWGKCECPKCGKEIE